MVTTDVQLKDAAQDGISAVAFSKQTSNNTHLLVASWDGTVRLHDFAANEVRARFDQTYPQLDACFGADGTRAFSGGLDRTVHSYDLVKQTQTTLGTHDDTIRTVVYHAQSNVLLTGSWDKTVKLWDPRASTPAQGTFAQHDTVYTMDVTDRRLVVGTAGRQVSVFDLRNLSEPEQKRESSLKFQTRCIRCLPSGEGYALSSIQGRVAVEYFDQAPEIQKRKFAFRCHRVKENGVETVYPVHAMAFNAKHGTFATGGGDGIVSVWDPVNQKRLREFPKYPAAISSLSFSPNGDYLAIAASYAWEDGEKEQFDTTNAVFVRAVPESDVKPKPKA